MRGKSETSEHNSIIGNKTSGRGSVKSGSGRPIVVSPHFRIDAKKGVNAPSVDRHIELPIGNKTNIVSIMLTKGWL